MTARDPRLGESDGEVARIRERAKALEPLLPTLIGCHVEIPRCYADAGEFCGDDPCPHGDADESLCPDCGNGAGLNEHAPDCRKQPALGALRRLLEAVAGLR